MSPLKRLFVPVVNVYGSIFTGMALIFGFNKEVGDITGIHLVPPVAEVAEPKPREKYETTVINEQIADALKEYKVIQQPNGDIILEVPPVKAKAIQAKVDAAIAADFKKEAERMEHNKWIVEEAAPKLRLAGLLGLGILAIFNIGAGLGRKQDMNSRPEAEP